MRNVVMTLSRQYWAEGYRLVMVMVVAERYLWLSNEWVPEWNGLLATTFGIPVGMSFQHNSFAHLIFSDSVADIWKSITSNETRTRLRLTHRSCYLVTFYLFWEQFACSDDTFKYGLWFLVSHLKPEELVVGQRSKMKQAVVLDREE